jgi:hypothetical protein
MGDMTLQWLKGNPLRQRGYDAWPVTVETWIPKGEWSEKRNQRICITATRKDEDYQDLFVTRADVSIMLPELVDVADTSVRYQTALKALTGLPDVHAADTLCGVRSL